MRKNGLRLWIGLLLLILLTPAVAHADLAGGSSGAEVVQLQTMLYDLGYLADAPDGQFGARTEAAVKAFQLSAGLEQTGIVTDDLFGQISQEWTEHRNWIEEQMLVDGEVDYPLFCRMWEDGDGRMVTAYCQEHALLWMAAENMLASGDAESALYAYYAWQAEVIRLYNEWIDLADEPDKAQIEAGKTLCIQMMDAQLKAVRASFGAEGRGIDPNCPYSDMVLWMRSHSAWLCHVLGTLNGK